MIGQSCYDLFPSSPSAEPRTRSVTGLVPYGGVYLPVPADNETSYPPPYAGAPETVPLAAVFGQLETDLLGSDPAVILNLLARDFYKPDRD